MQHAAGLRQGLQAGRDVDAVAEEIPSSSTTTSPRLTPMRKTMRRSVGISAWLLGNALLDGDRARDRIDDRAELHERTVAHQLDDTALVLGQQRIDHLPAQSLQGRQRPGLVMSRRGGSSRRRPRPGSPPAAAPPLQSPWLSLPQEIRRLKPRRLTRHAPSGCPTPRPCRFMIPLRRSCGDASRECRLQSAGYPPSHFQSKQEVGRRASFANLLYSELLSAGAVSPSDEYWP